MLTSPRAVSSFRLGLLSFLFNVFTGLPAIVQGVRGLRDIRRDAGHLKGKGLALTGMGTALLGTSFGIALLVPAVQKVRDAADRAT